MRVNLTGPDAASFPPFLPLHTFDDSEFDCHNPNEWLELGFVNGKQHPVPGKALLSRDNGKNGTDHAWTDVGTLDYDAEKQLFLVQVVGTGGLQHNVIPTANGVAENGVVNGDILNEGLKRKHPILEAQQVWVPRIQLCLLLKIQ